MFDLMLGLDLRGGSRWSREGFVEEGCSGVYLKNNNNKKIIHENSTLNNVENIYQTKFLFSNLL